MLPGPGIQQRRPWVDETNTASRDVGDTIDLRNRLLTQLPAVTSSVFGNMTWILIPTGTWIILKVSVDISTGRCQVMEKLGYSTLKSVTSQCTCTHARLYIHQYQCRYFIRQSNYCTCSCFCVKHVAQFSATHFKCSLMSFEKHFVFFFKTIFRLGNLRITERNFDRWSVSFKKET